MIDVFQRYKSAYQVVKSESAKSKNLNLLDVGSNGIGFGAYNNFSNVKQTNIDIQDFDKEVIKNNPHIDFITYDGSVFPFGDNSFDIVVCSDTLEHIPLEYREKFIEENFRVSKNLVVFTFPVKSSALFEKILYYATFKKSSFLREHIEYGLPDPSSFEEKSKTSGFTIVGKTENINRFLWIPVKLLSSLELRLWRKKSKEWMFERFLNFVKKNHWYLNFGRGYSKTYILKKKQR